MDSMIQIRTTDGREEQLAEDTVKELIPYGTLFTSPLVREPYAALLYYRDRILPVRGPLPTAWDVTADVMERPWILVFNDYARVVIGLPEFDVQAESAQKSA
jgi:hypothetical protein